MAGEDPWLESGWIQFLGKARNQYIWRVKSREGENWGRSRATNAGFFPGELWWLTAFASSSAFLPSENARFRGKGGTDGRTGETERRVHVSFWWKAPRPSGQQRSVTFSHPNGLVVLCRTPEYKAVQTCCACLIFLTRWSPALLQGSPGCLDDLLLQVCGFFTQEEFPPTPCLKINTGAD